MTISSKLALDELSYIVEDSRAKMLIVSPELQPVVAQIGAKLQGQPGMELYMVLEKSPPAPYKSLEAERDKYPKTPIADQSAGGAMLYSSGSTGRPKGILRLPPLPGPDGKLPPTAADFDDFDGRKPAAVTGIAVFGWRPFDSIYLSPAPLYHAAPIGFTMGIHALGGTVIVMERFNEEGVLRLIDQYKCTTGQFVPTHFIRMLRLPDSVKRKYSVASLKGIFHAVAPCPVPVKKAMIDWLGPIVHEYYAGSESNGTCIITADDWIRKPGTVGKPFPPVKVHIWDEDKGVEITQVGQEGAVYFEGGGRFEYSNSPEKTKESTNKFGWTTLGDVGFLDADGYLFLTDRKAFMVGSGNWVCGRCCRGRVPLLLETETCHSPCLLSFFSDHLGRRQHLPIGNRKRSAHAPGRPRRRRRRCTRPRDGRTRGRRRPTDQMGRREHGFFERVEGLPSGPDFACQDSERDFVYEGVAEA